MVKKIKLDKVMTPRLLAIASRVPSGSKLADVGTDHAYIPIYLLQKGVIHSAIAMDINPGPLRRAQENIKKYGMESKISTRLSDGLLQLDAQEADAVVIAGMGGLLICEIMDAGRALFDSIHHFILQPMTAAEEVRRYLERRGFAISAEVLAREDEKLYNVIVAERGSMHMNREADYYIGPKLMERKEKHTPAFVEAKIREYEKIKAGLEKSSNTELSERLAYVKQLLGELYDMREECRTW